MKEAENTQQKQKKEDQMGKTTYRSSDLAGFLLSFCYVLEMSPVS